VTRELAELTARPAVVLWGERSCAMPMLFWLPFIIFSGLLSETKPRRDDESRDQD